MKKGKQYRFSVCYKSFRNDAKYNISSYLKIGNIFSSPRGWVHRFHLLGLILQKNNKIWEISNCKCRRSLWICLFFIVFSGRFPLLEAFVPFFFSQVERSNLWYNILGSENTYTVPNRYWASPKTTITIQFCLRADVSYFLCCTRATKEIGDVCTQATFNSVISK